MRHAVQAYVIKLCNRCSAVCFDTENAIIPCVHAVQCSKSPGLFQSDLLGSTRAILTLHACFNCLCCRTSSITPLLRSCCTMASCCRWVCALQCSTIRTCLVMQSRPAHAKVAEADSSCMQSPTLQRPATSPTLPAHIASICRVTTAWQSSAHVAVNAPATPGPCAPPVPVSRCWASPTTATGTGQQRCGHAWSSMTILQVRGV